MTTTEFAAWLAHMALSERAAASMLGVSAAAVGDWRRGISRTTGRPIKLPPLLPLACAALAAELRPWGDS